MHLSKILVINTGNITAVGCSFNFAGWENSNTLNHFSGGGCRQAKIRDPCENC